MMTDTVRLNISVEYKPETTEQVGYDLGPIVYTDQGSMTYAFHAGRQVVIQQLLS